MALFCEEGLRTTLVAIVTNMTAIVVSAAVLVDSSFCVVDGIELVTRVLKILERFSASSNSHQQVGLMS